MEKEEYRETCRPIDALLGKRSSKGRGKGRSFASLTRWNKRRRKKTRESGLDAVNKTTPNEKVVYQHNKREERRRKRPSGASSSTLHRPGQKKTKSYHFLEGHEKEEGGAVPDVFRSH